MAAGGFLFEPLTKKKPHALRLAGSAASTSPQTFAFGTRQLTIDADKKRLRARADTWTRVHAWDKEQISFKQALNLKLNEIDLMLIDKGLERIELVSFPKSGPPTFYALDCNRRSRLSFLEIVASALVPTDAKSVPANESAVLLSFDPDALGAKSSTKIKDASPGVADENWPKFIEDVNSYREPYGPWTPAEASTAPGLLDGDSGVGIDKLNEYLSRRNPREIREKVREFRQLDFKRMSYSEVRSAVNAVVSAVDEEGEPFHFIPLNWVTYQEGSLFYRVVRHPVRSRSDLWAPPEAKVRIGRLNLLGESVLYTSPDLRVALDEMDVQDGELTTVIQYSSRESTVLTKIGMFPNDHTAAAHADVLDELDDFFRDEFRRDVGQGTEYLYKISNVISEYFVAPKSAGYYYPSTSMKRQWNVCFNVQDIDQQLNVTSVGQYRFWRDPNADYMPVRCERKASIGHDVRVVWQT